MDKNTIISAFAAVDAALGLTAAESDLCKQLGSAAEVVAAKHKKELWIAARAGMARMVIFKIAVWRFGMLDIKATAAALAAEDDFRIGKIEIDSVLERLEKGDMGECLNRYTLPLKFLKAA